MSDRQGDVIPGLASPLPQPDTYMYRRLTARAAWYRDGCPHLDDGEQFFTSGDVARDAAADLEQALSEIRVLDSVIQRLREHPIKAD